MKKRIMIFCDFYLPGFKSGGGMRTVVNLVERFCDQYDFFIVTRDYDSKSDTAPYANIKIDDWNAVECAQVYYFSNSSLSHKKIAALIEEVKPDTFFLNSAFSMPVRNFLFVRRKGLVSEIPVILATCGEMAKGALSVKPLKKKLFLKYSEFVGLYDGVIWKASFDEERAEIRDIMGSGVEVMVAPDLAPKTILPDYSLDWKPKKEKGKAKFVVISRLVPNKNISYFLERLLDIRDGEVFFDIIGPFEDQTYWKRCERIIARLPKNISVSASGAVPQRDVLGRLCESHFFTMPTLSENFGYVFIESLAAGCPLLISDRTAWTDVEERNVGWRIPLENPEKYVEQINKCIAMEEAEYSEMSRMARQYAVGWLAKPEIFEATARVLSRALNEHSQTVRNAR